MDHSVHDVDNDLILREEELRTGRHQGDWRSFFLCNLFGVGFFFLFLNTLHIQMV
jgi:hypothetical protein